MKLLEEQAHAAKGASSSARWMACPGSVVLEKFFHNEDTPYSREGSLCHALAERCLNTGEDPVNYLYNTQSDFEIMEMEDG